MDGSIQTKENILGDKNKQRTEISELISQFPINVEKYQKVIEGLELKEKEMEVKLSELRNKKKSASKELKEFQDGIFRNVEEDESLDDRSYYFHDVFQLKSKNLEESKRLEKRLTLIKNAVFVDAKNTQLRPKSSKYHIPLKEFEPSKVELPFGLMLNDEVPEDIGLRASEWLVRIVEYLDDDGVIRDVVGVRGFKEETDPSLVLSKMLKDWTIKNMEAKIRDYKGKIQILEEEQASVKKEVVYNRKHREQLNGYNMDLKRLNGEIALIEEEIQKLKEKLNSDTLKKYGMDKDAESLNPLHENLVKFKAVFSTETASGNESSKDQILKHKDEVLMDIPIFKKNMEYIDSCEKTIISIKKDLKKTEEQITFFIVNQNEALKIEETIKQLESKIEKLTIHITLLLNNKQELESWKIRMKGNIDELKRYFGEIEPLEVAMEYDMEELLEKTSNTYAILRVPLNGIENQIEDNEKKIDSTQEALDTNYRVLEKVLSAMEELKKKDELGKMKTDKENLAVYLSTLQAQEKILQDELNKLNKSFEEAKASQERFQRYLDKWEGVDWLFYEEYNEKSDKENRITLQLLPLADKKNVLTTSLSDLRMDKLNLETEKKALNTSIQNILNDITTKNEQKNSLEQKLQGYSTQLSYSFENGEGYQRLIDLRDFDKITLKDYMPTFKSMYLTKFSMAIESKYVKDFDGFVYMLNIAPKVIPNEDEFKDEMRALKNIFTTVFQTLKETIQESSEKNYQLMSQQCEKTQKEKEETEAEVLKNEKIVNFRKQDLELRLKSAVNKTQEILNSKVNKLGYIVRLDYIHKDDNGGVRQLKLYFSQAVYGSTQLREIRGDDGMSGGEHAAVSLMIMYAIMKVKELVDGKEDKQGGYLLLDEWDAALDPNNSRIIFNFLEELGKKIISITPRSSYEEYLEKFGVLIRVTQVGRSPMVVMINKNNESVREMIEESRLEEVASTVNGTI